MAAAVVDLDINEGDTFVMTIEGWEDVDNTLPMDWGGDTFIGSFEFSGVTIPMIVSLQPNTGTKQNIVEATVTYDLMVELPSQGKYDIDQLTSAGERYRLIQGTVRVNPEVTK